MTLSYPSPEFEDAVAAVCDDRASDGEMLALNRLLLHNPGARDAYLLRLELHSRLASEPDLFAGSPAAAGSRPNTDVLEVRNSPRSREASPRHRGPILEKPMAWALGLAAGLLLAGLGTWVLWRGWSSHRTGSSSPTVAMLTRVVDVRWGQAASAPRVGGALKRGELELKSGLAQIVFYSGARVIIEGPAKLQLVSPSEAMILNGRLLAEVPEPARGFRLRTDHLKVVDLGTSFGIETSPRRTEVHVFKGKVDLLAGTREKQSLSESQAAAVEGETAPRLMAASASVFASMFDFQQRSLASEAFRYERWQFANAQLNEDPSLVVHLDFENLSGTDWTLRNAAERNRTVPNATVVGCVRGEGRWREKQSLELQTVNDRVRLAVPGTFDALTLSAWVCLKGLDRRFNSLFMCDGFEPGTIHWLIRQDGVLGLTVMGTPAGKFQIMASPSLARLHEFGMWVHLAVVLDGRHRCAVHYVNGEPVSRHALRIEPPFRVGSAELGNWSVPSGADLLPFPIRNLTGSFDEFALFNRALSDAEVRELHAQGKPDP